MAQYFSSAARKEHWIDNPKYNENILQECRGNQDIVRIRKKLRELCIKHTCHTKVVWGSYLNRKQTIKKGTQKSGTRNEHGK